VDAEVLGDASWSTPARAVPLDRRPRRKHARFSRREAPIQEVAMRLVPWTLAALAVSVSLAGDTGEGKDTEKKKWDVNAPPGAAGTVAIDTRTGSPPPLRSGRD
jgi:hypothetical protein